jgi:FtsP/CotA-like multicopper oxidase with cupredoxin domain
MYLKRSAPKNRQREAQHARDNRAEIVRALGLGEVTRRDLLRMGIFTAAGTLALKNGLSPFASSAYGAIPTGTPRSPLFGAQRFSQPMPRLNLQQPHRLEHVNVGGETEAKFPVGLGEPNAKRLSWHTEFTASQGANFRNPLTGRGPMEGRPPGAWFGHQAWNRYLPQVGYRMSLGQVGSGKSFHPNMPAQAPNSVWSFGTGGLGTRGMLPPPLVKVRYGEPVVMRVYNSTPQNRADNGGFGRNEVSLHNHNAHNGSASDGANNAYFFPGQFYDYHWGTCLARSDTAVPNAYACGVDDDSATYPIAGDWRELQSTLWFHDHRFFFTAENVYKGSVGMMNYYSGRDRGNEAIADGVNLCLPSGKLLPWGNVDFDVNLLISDFALNPGGQLFFDIFDTDGFLGDNLLVNSAFSPYLNVIKRKYRFRLLNACMSRFIKLAVINQSGTTVPVTVIGNDGNFLVNPVKVDKLDPQGSAERFDIIVDFSPFKAGDKLWLINLMEHEDGRGPKEALSVKDAINRKSNDPAVGTLLEFRLVTEVGSVDVPGVTYRDTDAKLDVSKVPAVLTEQIPVVEPVRTREIEFKRSENQPFTGCIPDCEGREFFPWVVRINGEDQHYMNANRASLIVPRPNEVEHWVLKNGGGGWDHPVHLHFEEGVTISRTKFAVSATERLARKDVWRLGEGGSVKVQVRFGEFGGAYVMHCHNTVHEDFAMLMRLQILKDDNGTGDPFVGISPTPNPTPDGVEFLTPEILPEGDPRRRTVARA